MPLQGRYVGSVYVHFDNISHSPMAHRLHYKNQCQEDKWFPGGIVYVVIVFLYWFKLLYKLKIKVCNLISSWKLLIYDQINIVLQAFRVQYKYFSVLKTYPSSTIDMCDHLPSSYLRVNCPWNIMSCGAQIFRWCYRIFHVACKLQFNHSDTLSISRDFKRCLSQLWWWILCCSH